MAKWVSRDPTHTKFKHSETWICAHAHKHTHTTSEEASKSTGVAVLHCLRGDLRRASDTVLTTSSNYMYIHAITDLRNTLHKHYVKRQSHASSKLRYCQKQRPIATDNGIIYTFRALLSECMSGSVTSLVSLATEPLPYTSARI